MRVLVVGGGITGLAAAHRLAAADVPVTLVEASRHLGGKIRTERTDGFLVEAGPDSVIATRPAAVQLARELGLGSELIGVQEPRGVFVRHRGRLVPMPEGLGLVLPTRIKPFALTPLFSPLEKARMGLDVLLPRVGRPEDEAVGMFLRRRLGDALVDRLAGPLVGGIYGTPIDELSLDAVLPTLREAERDHRSLLFAGLAQGRAAAAARGAGFAAAAAARGAGFAAAAPAPAAVPAPAAGSAAARGAGSGAAPAPAAGSAAARGAGSGAAPAPAGPAAVDPSPRPSLGMFISLAGGMGRLTEELEANLAAAAAVDLRVGTTVSGLERRPGGIRATLSDGSHIDADMVVITTPAPIAGAMLGPIDPRLPELLATIPHGSTAVVSLAYEAERFERPPAGHGFVVAAGEDLGISACTISSAKWAGRAPEGTVLLRAFVPDGPLLAGSDDELAALARRDVERTLGAHGEPVLVRVARWNGAMPRYTVGHLQRLAAIEMVLADEPAVVVAGAAYRGVGIPDCVSQGHDAAARAIARLSDVAAAA